MSTPKRRPLTEKTLDGLGFPVSIEFSSGNNLILDCRQAFRFGIHELFDAMITQIAGEQRNESSRKANSGSNNKVGDRHEQRNTRRKSTKGRAKKAGKRPSN